MLHNHFIVIHLIGTVLMVVMIDQYDTYQMLQKLLAVNASAACIPDHSGRVPFWMWQLNAKSNTKSTISTNVPRTTTMTTNNTGTGGRSWLSKRDPLTGLYPFLLAAAAASKEITKSQSHPSNVDDVVTCYCSYCCNNSTNVDYNNDNVDGRDVYMMMTEYENEAVTTSRSRRVDLDSLTTIYKLLLADPTQAYMHAVTS